MGFRLLILPILLPILGCGPEPAYISKAGTSFFYESGAKAWAPAQIEAQESAFIQGLSKLPGYTLTQIEKALAEAEAHIYPKPIPCPGQSGTGFCAGMEEGSVLKIWSRGCPYDSALTHEEGHWLQYKILGVYDYDHKETEFWAIADARAGTCP